MFHNLTIPQRLQKGDSIGIVSPSAGLAGLFPHRADNGALMLEKMGFKVVFSKHARDCEGWVSSSVEHRIEDLHDMFTRKEIKLILCAIGGNHANQLIKYLDYDLIKANPKLFVGYSDITVLHHALASQAHLQTYYGPCLVSEFGEYPEVLEYTKHWFQAAVTGSLSGVSVEAPTEWTDEFLDWFAKKDLERPRILARHHGYEWWRKGSASGPIWGGAVSSINHLAGTKYWVDPTGSIFFLDIPEGGPGSMFSQSDLDAYLADLNNLSVFQDIKGLIIGRPYRYAEQDSKILKDIISKYTEGYSYPILYNVAIGHTAPIMTVPLGAMVNLDSEMNEFSFL